MYWLKVHRRQPSSCMISSCLIKQQEENSGTGGFLAFSRCFSSHESISQREKVLKPCMAKNFEWWLNQNLSFFEKSSRRDTRPQLFVWYWHGYFYPRGKQRPMAKSEVCNKKQVVYLALVLLGSGGNFLFSCSTLQFSRGKRKAFILEKNTKNKICKHLPLISTS